MTNEEPIPLEEGELVRNALSQTVELEMGGGMLTNYHVIAEYIDNEGDTSWFIKCNNHQTGIVTLGLIEYARLLVNHELNRNLHELFDGDNDD